PAPSRWPVAARSSPELRFANFAKTPPPPLDDDDDGGADPRDGGTPLPPPPPAPKPTPAAPAPAPEVRGKPKAKAVKPAPKPAPTIHYNSATSPRTFDSAVEELLSAVG
ncbi:hypothetical protein RA999_20135, partial [Mycobacteroides abscessus subsp. massiliense]